MNTRIVPCLVVDPEGKTKVTLEKGPRATFQHPDWRCLWLGCLNREKCTTKGFSVHDPFQVKLDTVGKIHGITWCEGGGKIVRK